MNEEGVKASSDLIRWLKMLALPGWAKVGLAAIMLLTLANALGLLVGGMFERDKDAIAAAVSILTVGLPLGLIVIALVFGDGGSRKNGCVFIKTLHEDFLLSPAQRLYFAQDLPFFVRGLLEASVRHG